MVDNDVARVMIKTMNKPKPKPVDEWEHWT